MILSDPLERAPEAHEISSLRKNLQQLSSYDQETGLPNHEALVGDINAKIANASPSPWAQLLLKSGSRVFPE